MECVALFLFFVVSHIDGMRTRGVSHIFIFGEVLMSGQSALGELRES